MIGEKRKGKEGGGLLNEKGGEGRARQKRITVCFDEEEYEQIKDAIEMDGRSASVIVREQMIRWATEIPKKKARK